MNEHSPQPRDRRPDNLAAAGRLAWRWRRFIATVTLAGCLAGVVSGALRGSTYTAEAILSVTPVSQDDVEYRGLSVLRDSGDSTRNVETVARLVVTRQVANAASAIAPGEGSPQALLGRVEVQPIGGSALVSIKATGASARSAAEVANAFAAGATRVLDARLTKQATTLATRLRAGIDDGTLGAEATRIAQTRIAQLDAAKASGDPTVTVDSGASPPASRSSAGPAAFGIIGALCGLVVGFGVAVIRERFGGAIRSRGQVEDRLGIPVIDNAGAGRGAGIAPDGLDVLWRAGPLVSAPMGLTGTIGIVGIHLRDGAQAYARQLARALGESGAPASLVTPDQLRSRPRSPESREGASPRTTLTLVDLPALDTGVTALTAARAVGRVALVVRRSASGMPDLVRAVRLLQEAQIEILAVVLMDEAPPAGGLRSNPPEPAEPAATAGIAHRHSPPAVAVD